MPSDNDELSSELSFFHATVGLYGPAAVIRYGLREMVRSNPRGVVDRLFEAERRNSEICRNKAVFLIGLPSGEAVAHRHFARSGASFPSGHVYRVKPSVRPTRHDRRWVDELQARHPPLISGTITRSISPGRQFADLPDEVVAENYWLSRPTDEPEWEYITDQASVLEHVIQRVINNWLDPEAFGVEPPSSR